MSRNVAIDVLKLILAFMVVGLHVGIGGEFLTNGLFRIAVPLFLLINGYYFFPILSKGNEISWLKRLVSLYCIWMLIYSYFWFHIPDATVQSYINLLRVMFIGYHHLWYVSGMIGAAIILIFLKKSNNIQLITLATLLFLIGVIIQYSGNYHYFKGSYLDNLFNQHFSHRNFLFFSLPFFVIGYLINKYSVQTKIGFRLSVFLSGIGLTLLLLESITNYQQPTRDGGFDNYFSLIIVCPAIFILFGKIKIEADTKSIALFSSAIYFLHVWVMKLLEKFTELDSYLLVFFTILLSLFASKILIFINNRFKYFL